MAENEKRTCTTCVLCHRSDYGYSNYTTEGTELSCLAGLNPGMEGQEEPWREMTPEFAAILDVARTCPRYREGVPLWTDVDHEELQYPSNTNSPDMIKATNYTDDDEAAELFARSLGWPSTEPT